MDKEVDKLCSSFYNVFVSDELFSETKFPVDYKSRKSKRLDRFNSILEKRKTKRNQEHRRRRTKLLQNGKKPIEIPQLRVLLDLTFCDFMSDKELKKLVRQLGRIWGLHKKYCGLDATLFLPSIRLLLECNKTLTGFASYRWTIIHPKDSENAYTCIGKHPIIFLSPDPVLPPLMELADTYTYVIGGLVDESGKGNITRQKADGEEWACYRLPIVEFMEKTDKGTFNLMLSTNIVVEILCRFAESQDWVFALEVVPLRTGYRISKT